MSTSREKTPQELYGPFTYLVDYVVKSLENFGAKNPAEHLGAHLITDLFIELEGDMRQPLKNIIRYCGKDLKEMAFKTIDIFYQPYPDFRYFGYFEETYKMLNSSTKIYSERRKIMSLEPFDMKKICDEARKNAFSSESTPKESKAKAWAKDVLNTVNIEDTITSRPGCRLKKNAKQNTPEINPNPKMF